MSKAISKHFANSITELQETGLFKPERVITTPQGGHIGVTTGQNVINLCANNYLGLADHPALVKAGQESLPQYGFGMASVRFICGTQTIHKTLEQRLAEFVGQADCILYSSCFDANTGLFETLLGAEDAIISDSLNHASIIDGIRLCKAQRFVYANSNMEELENHLKAAQNCRFRLIATDGVFSMDGSIANLPAICDLAEKYDALVMVDDSHAVGFMGANGRGTHEYHNVIDRIDIITGTLGKALGGASGGYTAASKEIVGWLRQRSRPYLFSNSLAPVVAATSVAVLDLLQKESKLRENLWENTRYFREKMTALGFNIIPGVHPIVPVMLGDAKLAGQISEALLKEGVYVIGFSFPVVPKDKARIRTQMSAAHTREELDRTIAAFKKVGTEFGIIK
jgi:glycine C-acetyltransferase